MKKFVKMLPLCVLALSVSACAACPETADYEQTPYAAERTAGEGTAVYGDDCRVRRVETRETVTRAEPVFQQRTQK